MWAPLLVALTALSPAPAPRVQAARTATVPVLDGRIDDPMWQRAPVGGGFTQKFPDEAAQPAEPTTFRVLYDNDAIYIAVDCVQTRTPVRAVLTRRDRDVEADQITVHIGSRRGEASAYQFGVNAAGVLSDALQFDDNQTSADWDENWEAAVSVHPGGWSTELRIPLRVLRFEPGGIQDWSFNVRRVTSFRQELDEWAFIPRTDAGVVSRYGRLYDLIDLRPQGRLEVRPFVLGKVSHLDPNFAAVQGYRPRLSVGIDSKWHVTPKLTLDATVLPDFGQVEQDQAVLNLTNTETFYEEKRAFFLEGHDLFATPLTLVHTRRIGGNPDKPELPEGEHVSDLLEPSAIYGALKLTGRATNQLDVGLLTAITGENRIDTRGPNNESFRRPMDPLTAFNVLRLRRRIGARAHIGFLGTAVNRHENRNAYPQTPAANAPPGAPADQTLCPSGTRVAGRGRCFHDAYVGALDGRWRSESGDYVAGAQAALSLVQAGPTRVLRDGTLIESGDLDRELSVSFNKEGGKHWLFESYSSSTGRRFDRNDLGYMERQSDWWLGGALTYRTTQPFGPALETHTGIDLSHGINLDGVPLHRGIEVDTDWQLKNFWGIELELRHRLAAFDDREVGDGSSLETPRTWGGDFELRSDPRRAVQASLTLALDLRSAGGDVYAGGSLLVRALPELDLELLPEVHASRGAIRFVETDAMGARLFGRMQATAVGSTLRATYTFTPRLSLQAYLQLFVASRDYDRFWTMSPSDQPRGQRIYVRNLQTLSPGPNDAGKQEGICNANLVLRWEYSLGSTLFVVYTRDQRALDVDLQSNRPRLDVRAVGRGPAANTLLIKLSRWWG